MYWLSSYHDILDCYAKTIRLAMPGRPRIEWIGLRGSYPSKVISYTQAQKLIDIGCLAYFAFIRDTIVEARSMDSILMVCEFSNVFSIDLPRVSPDKDIDFDINLKSGTKPISITPNHIAPTKLKELKEQLQDLLSKGFIHYSGSR